MPNRIIKESICTSENLDQLTWFEEVFFYRLIVNCDDYGRMDARVKILRSRMFPLKSVTHKQITLALNALRSAGMIDTYEVDGRPFLQIRTWENHQLIKEKKIKYPDPKNKDFTDHALDHDHEKMKFGSDLNPIQSKSKSNTIHSERSEEKMKNKDYFSPPSLEVLENYCKAEGLNIDIPYFMKHYTDNGWTVENRKMRDWKAVARAWAKKNKESSAKPKVEHPRYGTFDAKEAFEHAIKRTYEGEKT